jgi:hypothetical protein
VAEYGLTPQELQEASEDCIRAHLSVILYRIMRNN